MKSIDLTKPGGIPLTQDRLAYLQQAYTEGIQQLLKMGIYNPDVPVILSGMNTTDAGGGNTQYHDGWFAYKGNIVRFVGSTKGVAPFGQEWHVGINDMATPLTFKDGSTPNVVHELQGTMVSMATTTDATHFPFSSLVDFQSQFVKYFQEANFSNVAVATSNPNGNVTGTIYYKKNSLTNTLQIYAQLTANHADNFAATPNSQFYVCGTLPAGYYPVTAAAWFTAYNNGLPMILDDASQDWIKMLSCYLDTAGNVNMNWLKPAGGTTSYTVAFNCVLPLD